MLRRPRRNRSNAAIRNMVEETHLRISNLVYPLFVVDGKGIKEEISSMPGNFRMSQDVVLKEIRECIKLGLTNFILFPAVAEKLKDKIASYSYSPDNFYLKIAKAIKKKFPDTCIISDVAMDPYSSDGHDGYVDEGQIVNVDEAGFYTTGIMSYTAKYASAFYGPFRDALDSAPKAGDKKTYQMNPANKKEALIEAELDTAEGADFLMVKPALNYLDVIHVLKQNFDLPIAAYHVSGECAMLIAACQKGWLEYKKAMPETLLSIHRAGADVIITYFAKDFAKLVSGRL